MKVKNIYFVSKQVTGYSDTLKALGLASLINKISDSKTSIQNHGQYYTIQSEKKISEDFSNYVITPGYNFIVDTKKNEKYKDLYEKIPQSLKIDINEQFQLLSKLKEADTDQQKENIREMIALRFNTELIPHTKPKYYRDTDLYLEIINRKDEIKEIVYERLKSYKKLSSQLILNIPNLEKNFKNIVTSSLFFNPQFTKGANSTKADSITRKAISKKFIDWFSEWMKYRGYSIAAIAREKDQQERRIFIINPSNIEIRLIRNLISYLESKIRFGGLKNEVRIIIEITKFLVLNSKEYKSPEFDKELETVFNFSSRKPKDIIKSVQVGLFRNMGKVYAAHSIYDLEIPDWFGISSKAEADAFLDLLNNFEKILNNLNENHSDEIVIIIKLHKFLGTGTERKFFMFTASFAGLIMQKASKNQFQKILEVNNLNNLFKMGFNMKYKQIVENQGFQAVATAIRKATIIPQYLKGSKGINPNWKIHYGFAQKMKKVVKISDSFISNLMEFIQMYNQENARLSEQGKRSRKTVKTSDLDELMSLIDEYGSEVVGMLLLAYGYASESKEET
jgi:hypothetical protein